MENTPDSIYFKDLESRFIKVSKGTLRKFKVSSEEELIGKTDFDFFDNKHATEARDDELEVIKTGKAFDNKVEKEVWPDGRVTWVSTSKVPLKDNEGNIIGTFGITRDITSYKEAEEKIKSYVKELELNKALIEEKAKELGNVNSKLINSEKKLKKMNANKDKFFSIISHDLRSPFSSLLGLSDFLKYELGDMDKEEIQQYISTLNKSAHGIYKLLDNLLHWSSLQTGRLEYKPEELNLRELILNILQLYNSKAFEKEITLTIEIAVDSIAYADNNMIDTVVRNLLNNSIKFTETGGEITITTKKTDDEIIVSISDNGVGINKKDITKLFRIEEHFTNLGTANESGTGLGLILCKEFIEKNGGKIWVESKEGKGTTFFFSLPKA